MISHILELALLVLTFLTCQARGDGSVQYDWKFANQTSSDNTTIVGCQTYSIELILGPYPPIPPFYMISFDESGTLTPQVDLLGGNLTGLKWTPQYPQGTKVHLAILDSLYTFTPMSETQYTIVNDPSSQNTTCNTPKPSSNMTLTSNAINNTSQSCLEILNQVSGGSAPYTFINILINGSAQILPSYQPGIAGITYSGFVGSKVLFGVNDTDGNWAWTPIITIVGDPACPNKDRTTDHKMKPSVIAGITVSVAVFLLAFVAILWRRHRRHRLRGNVPSVDPFFKNPLPARFSLSSSTPRTKASELRHQSSVRSSMQLSTVTTAIGVGGREETIVQHRDGGAVTELPPPYKDLQARMEAVLSENQPRVIRGGK